MVSPLVFRHSSETHPKPRLFFIYPNRMADNDFDVDSLATYLHLTPDQVRKMANRGKLPGRRINDRWKFSRAEIHHWFEDRIGISDEDELKQVEQVLHTDAKRQHSPDMTIEELLEPELIQSPLLARTKSRVIENMCELAAGVGRLWLSLIHISEPTRPY